MKEFTGTAIVVTRHDPNNSDPVEVFCLLEAPHSTIIPADYRNAITYARQEEYDAYLEEFPEFRLEGDPHDPPAAFCDQLGIWFETHSQPVTMLGDWHPAFKGKES